ncbi:hypothetical protein HOY80DRAFT_996195 [Tuber brumale]|nr:hypothetical protein HOY80DRAFT_996195 [Tuber brumale]
MGLAEMGFYDFFYLLSFTFLFFFTLGPQIHDAIQYDMIRTFASIYSIYSICSSAEGGALVAWRLGGAVPVVV